MTTTINKLINGILNFSTNRRIFIVSLLQRPIIKFMELYQQLFREICALIYCRELGGRRIIFIRFPCLPVGYRNQHT